MSDQDSMPPQMNWLQDEWDELEREDKEQWMANTDPENIRSDREEWNSMMKVGLGMGCVSWEEYKGQKNFFRWKQEDWAERAPSFGYVLCKEGERPTIETTKTVVKIKTIPNPNIPALIIANVYNASIAFVAVLLALKGESGTIAANFVIVIVVLEVLAALVIWLSTKNAVSTTDTLLKRNHYTTLAFLATLLAVFKGQPLALAGYLVISIVVLEVIAAVVQQIWSKQTSSSIEDTDEHDHNE